MRVKVKKDYESRNSRQIGRCQTEKNIYTTYKPICIKLSKKAFIDEGGKSNILHEEKNSKYSFEDVLTIWMKINRIRLKKSTLAKYQNIIDKHLKKDLGSTPIYNLNSEIINEYLTQKKENGRLDGKGGLSSSYVKSMMLIINSCIQFASAEGFCKPLKSPIYKPLNEKKELRILNYEEQQKLECFLLTDVTPTKIGVLLSLYSGLRIGEICALKWTDIDISNAVIYVKNTVSRIHNDPENSSNGSRLIIDSPKTPSSFRMIPISSKIIPILEKAKKNANYEYVVASSNSFVSPRTYEYRFHKILEDSNISHINYHAIRHTFATRCVEQGVDIKSLSEILGHSSVSITMNTYVHSSIELKRTQIEKISYVSA